MPHLNKHHQEYTVTTPQAGLTVFELRSALTELLDEGLGHKTILLTPESKTVLGDPVTHRLRVRVYDLPQNGGR